MLMRVLNRHRERSCKQSELEKEMVQRPEHVRKQKLNMKVELIHTGDIKPWTWRACDRRKFSISYCHENKRPPGISYEKQDEDGYFHHEIRATACWIQTFHVDGGWHVGRQARQARKPRSHHPLRRHSVRSTTWATRIQWQWPTWLSVLSFSENTSRLPPTWGWWGTKLAKLTTPDLI